MIITLKFHPDGLEGTPKPIDVPGVSEIIIQHNDKIYRITVARAALIMQAKAMVLQEETSAPKTKVA